MRTMMAALLFTVISTSLHAPQARAEAGIVALEKWGRYHVNIVPYMPTLAPPKGKKVVWYPKVSLVFKVTSPESDDVILLQHYRGKKKWGKQQVCQIQTRQMIKRRGKGGKPMGYSLVVPICLADEKLATSKTGNFSVKVSYKQTGMGKVHADLGHYRYKVRHYNHVFPGGKKRAIKGFVVDHDFRLGEAWLYQNSEGQLQLWTWFKYDRKGEAAVRGARLRCFVGDKKLKFYNNPTRRTTIHHEHYKNAKQHNKITWGLWYFWTARIDGLTGGEWIAKNPGSYRCTMTQAGDIAREFYFDVNKDGKVKPAPCQTAEGTGQVKAVDGEVLIKMKVVTSNDLKHDKKAFKRSGLYGRKWPAGCPL